MQEGSGTGNARTCLSAAGYALGVLSMENAPDLTTRVGGQRADRDHGVHHQLPVFLGTRVLVHADTTHRRAVARLRPADGFRRRVPAGDQGEPDEDRRRAAGGVSAAGRPGRERVKRGRGAITARAAR